MTNLTKTDTFQAIKASAELIRKYPTDIDGVINRETARIIELTDEMLLAE